MSAPTHALPPSPVRPAARSEDAEEELDELDLPPLDDDEEEPDRDDDFTEPLAPDDGDDALDDVEASDLDVGEEDSVEDEASFMDDGGEDTVDVGDLGEGLVEAESDGSLGDVTEGIAGEDADIDEFDDGGDDGGAEGTDDPIEDDVDDALLPELDADDDGDFEETETVGDELEGALPGWIEPRWVVREGAGATVPCAAVAVGRGRVVAAGDVVLVVEEGAHAARRASFEGGALAVAITEEAIVTANARGQIALGSGDADATLLAGFGDRSAVVRRSGGPIALAATPGRAWVLQAGSIWSLAGSPPAATPVREAGVIAMAAAGPALVALTQEGGAPRIERLRSDDEGWQARAVEGAAKVIATGSEICFAAGAAGRSVAFADPSRGIALSMDGGGGYRIVPLLSVIALCFAGDDEGAPLLAVLAHELGGGLFVARVDKGGTSLVAEIRIAESVGAAALEELGGVGPAQIAWDSAREVAWIACRAGLLAVGPARQH